MLGVKTEIEKQLKEMLKEAQKIASVPVRLETLEKIARIYSTLK